MYTEIDYEKLRNDIMDYYGTAISCNPMALIDLFILENSSIDELVEIAIRNGFDLDNYTKQKKR